MHASSMYTRTARVNAPRAAGIALSCLFAALAFAALDDITTGSEPDLMGEWTTVAAAATWFLWGGARVRKRRPRHGAGTGRRGPEDGRP